MLLLLIASSPLAIRWTMSRDRGIDLEICLNRCSQTIFGPRLPDKEASCGELLSRAPRFFLFVLAESDEPLSNQSNYVRHPAAVERAAQDLVCLPSGSCIEPLKG